MEKTFVDRCLAGEKLDIDDFVDEWHRLAGLPTMDARSIYEHLGMTWTEYAEWVEHPERVHEIIGRRAKNVSPTGRRLGSAGMTKLEQDVRSLRLDLSSALDAPEVGDLRLQLSIARTYLASLSDSLENNHAAAVAIQEFLDKRK